MHKNIIAIWNVRRLPYILVLVLVLALGACAPKTSTLPELPNEQGTIERPSQKPSTDDVLGNHDVDFGTGGDLTFEVDDNVTPTEVLNLKLPSTFKNGKKLTSAEREALLTVNDLDRNLKVEDYEIIMPYFSFYVHESRMTIKHMVKNADPYIAYVREVFKENGIPEELAYLGMIESVYRPTAVSPVGAAGVWQFMPGTGKAYGLHQDWWVDERRDVYKATQSAAKYLKILYNYFHDWLLVVTAYNAGEGTVLRALKETGTDNFFDLARNSTGRHARLKPESQRYAPTFLAVTKIMRNLESLDFEDFADDEPQAVSVTIPAGTDLLAMTKDMGMPWKEFTARNAAFRRYVSPPDRTMVVYLDAKDRQAAKAFLAKPHKTYAGWESYKVKKGDTLGAISQNSGVPVAVLCRVNNITPKRLRIGSTIMIPSKAGADLEAGLARKEQQATSKKTGKTADYVVKKGDTLYSIAHAHGLEWEVLMKANGLTSSSNLHIGQHLKIPAKGDAAISKPVASKSSKPAQPQERIVHVVKKGETLYSIARQYGTSVAAIVKENKIDDPQSVGLNRCLEIPVTSKTPASAGTYTVQQGDTIWSVARRFDMPPAALLERNSLKKNAILHVGDILNIDRY